MKHKCNEHEPIYSSSFRVRKTAEAKIINSPQIPPDFFGHHRSLHSSSKPKLSSKKAENSIFEEFMSMFKMSR